MLSVTLYDLIKNDLFEKPAEICSKIQSIVLTIRHFLSSQLSGGGLGCGSVRHV